MNCKLITENDCAVSAVLSCSPAEFLIINKVISRCSTNEDFAESDRKTMALMGKAMMNFEQVEVADTPQTNRIKTADYCDICNHKGCDNCIANNLDDYCVPSGYEPITKTETENSNLTFEKRTMLDCYNCKRYKSDDACVECRYEPNDTPQTESYYTDATHFGKAKGESTNTADTPQTDCAWK